MRRLLLALGLCASACAGTADDGTAIYASSDLELITAYTAREMCACLFVQERTEEYCRAWTKQNPAVYSLTVDLENKVVHSGALGFWDATARLVDERRGCLLDP